jgi:hypothetical protein
MLYLHGGAILPVGLPYNHVGESKLQDELTLFVALDKDGTFFTLTDKEKTLVLKGRFKCNQGVN